ncbi:MAG: hypothetical protein ABIA74_06090 [bacterium]|nr:hypothetical protein [Patescibacteria group bacterium]
MKENTSLKIKIWIFLYMLGFASLGIFLIVFFPIMNYLSPAHPTSVLARIRLPLSIYSVIIGILYMISCFLIAKLKFSGIKLAIFASVIGIFLGFPIVGLVLIISYYFLPSVKEQFQTSGQRI